MSKVNKPKAVVKKRLLKHEDGSTRYPVSKSKPLPELKNIDELRQIKNVIGKLASAVERLLKQQGSMVKDINDMRLGLFQSRLEKGLKNSKKLKKQFDKKKFKLLEKCGVEKKANLTEEDVARIKTRIDLV